MAIGRQMFRERRFSQRAKAVAPHVAARRAEDCKFGGEQMIDMERKERRQQHPLRQIASGSEEHESVRGLCHGSLMIQRTLYSPFALTTRVKALYKRRCQRRRRSLETFTINAPRRNSLLSAGNPPVSGMNAQTAKNPAAAR